MNICETWLITKVMFLTNIHMYMKSWNNILLILVLSTLNKLFCLLDIEVYLWCKRYINTVGGAQQARPAAWASYCIVKCRLISITFWYSSPGRRINCSLNWKHFNGRYFFLLFNNYSVEICIEVSKMSEGFLSFFLYLKKWPTKSNIFWSLRNTRMFIY